jgi:hypothetical protein
LWVADRHNLGLLLLLDPVTNALQHPAEGARTDAEVVGHLCPRVSLREQVNGRTPVFGQTLTEVLPLRDAIRSGHRTTRVGQFVELVFAKGTGPSLGTLLRLLVTVGRLGLALGHLGEQADQFIGSGKGLLGEEGGEEHLPDLLAQVGGVQGCAGAPVEITANDAPDVVGLAIVQRAGGLGTTGAGLLEEGDKGMV